MGPLTPGLPESPVGEYSIRCLAEKTSTDRSSFEANRGLTYQEAASPINHENEGLGHIDSKEKRSLTSGGLIEPSNQFISGRIGFS
jgi:hypothetical protein